MRSFFQRFQSRRRPLTDGERQMVADMFGGTLNADTVEIVGTWWIVPNFAMSPNGNIYFSQRDWRTDFSQAELSVRSWLVHELTHVWQYQRGMAVVRRALFNRRYRYVLAAGRDFLSYGIEQQAQLVQDYYIRRELEAECHDWEQCLAPYLPIARTARADASLQRDD